MSVALEYHLQYNHYPPVTTQMIPFCEEAIAAVANGDPDHVVTFPLGHTVTAGKIVEDLHLDDFVNQFDYTRSRNDTDHADGGPRARQSD